VSPVRWVVICTGTQSLKAKSTTPSEVGYLLERHTHKQYTSSFVCRLQTKGSPRFLHDHLVTRLETTMMIPAISDITLRMILTVPFLGWSNLTCRSFAGGPVGAPYSVIGRLVPEDRDVRTRLSTWVWHTQTDRFLSTREVMGLPCQKYQPVPSLQISANCLK